MSNCHHATMHIINNWQLYTCPLREWLEKWMRDDRRSNYCQCQVTSLVPVRLIVIAGWSWFGIDCELLVQQGRPCLPVCVYSLTTRFANSCSAEQSYYEILIWTFLRHQLSSHMVARFIRPVMHNLTTCAVLFPVMEMIIQLSLMKICVLCCCEAFQEEMICSRNFSVNRMFFSALLTLH